MDGWSLTTNPSRPTRPRTHVARAWAWALGILPTVACPRAVSSLSDATVSLSLFLTVAMIANVQLSVAAFSFIHDRQINRRKDPRPYCDDCLVPLKGRHLLVECPSLMDLRQRYLYRCCGRDSGVF
ncbi:hypothetical protein E2C01_002379 [Portunus trituberculatus]|uniref:Uncharacterized protein n=1 Tax=Portunus trituberculatus TaxID=210409 RepID=A0A5B7CLT1_PORTR|nr:hypothetical protein [Portunus trituberculatus]